MIISPLYNNVSKKIKFWKEFSLNNECEFIHYVTKSRDVSTLKITYLHNGISVIFKESDGKPLICMFEISSDKRISLDIRKITVFDKIFNSVQSNHPFLKKFYVKSNSNKIKDRIVNDKELLDLLFNSQFSTLYGYFKVNKILIRLTTSFFVNNYDRLNQIYLIINSLIDKINDSR